MEYEIIDKDQVPDKGLKGRWTSLFDKLEPSKALRFGCEDESAFKKLRDKLHQAVFYYKRPYKIATLKAIENGEIILYAWKETNNETIRTNYQEQKGNGEVSPGNS